MAFTTEMSLVANTIKKLHIQFDLNFVYRQKIYHDKQDIMDELFHKYLDHSELITE